MKDNLSMFRPMGFEGNKMSFSPKKRKTQEEYLGRFDSNRQVAKKNQNAYLSKFGVSGMKQSLPRQIFGDPYRLF